MLFLLSVCHCFFVFQQLHRYRVLYVDTYLKVFFLSKGILMGRLREKQWFITEDKYGFYLR